MIKLHPCGPLCSLINEPGPICASCSGMNWPRAIRVDSDRGKMGDGAEQAYERAVDEMFYAEQYTEL